MDSLADVRRRRRRTPHGAFRSAATCGAAPGNSGTVRPGYPGASPNPPRQARCVTGSTRLDRKLRLLEPGLRVRVAFMEMNSK
jgi:hypothetical protein